MLETASPTLRVPRDSESMVVSWRAFLFFTSESKAVTRAASLEAFSFRSRRRMWTIFLASSSVHDVLFLRVTLIFSVVVSLSLLEVKLRVQRVCTLHGVGRSRSLGVNFSLPRNGVTFDGCPLMLSFGKGSGQCTDGYPLVNLLEPQFLLAVSTSTQHFFAPATTKSVRSTGSSRKPKFSFTIQWRTTVGDVFAAFVDDILSLFMFFYRPLSADRLSIMEVAAKAVLQQRS